MQEYRSRLTSDIVTGKLDVREAAAGLPDLPRDQELTKSDARSDEEGEGAEAEVSDE